MTMPLATEELISPARLREMVLQAKGADRADRELSILDVREEADYATGHLLLASSAPLSRLELVVGTLVPRLSTPIILCDGREDLAARGREVLGRIGYSNVSVLEGGVSAAPSAGFRLFSGTNVASKAFGEFVETIAGTPHIDPLELKRRLDRADDLIVIDSRSPEEFFEMNIPGAQNLPGAEIVYRIQELVPSPETTIVVNCAGRTRSIIGAQSLRNAGVPNPVFALRNGTMGWRLAGLHLGHGATSQLPAVTPAGLVGAQRAATRVGRQCGVPRVDYTILNRWRAERSTRNLFVLDVRTREEYEAGHLTDARWAPGGQLVQETDRYIGVRNSRIVLVDDIGVRTTMTASWLRQMGWRNVVVLDSGLDGEALTTGDGAPDVLPVPHPVPQISADALPALLRDRKVAVIDLARSSNYRAAHIPGARFAIRSRLKAVAPALADVEAIVLTSENGVLAQFAHPELAAAVNVRVLALAGGTDAWRRLGLPVDRGWFADQPAGDVWIEPYDYGTPAEIEQQMRRYLEWEVALTDEVRADGSVDFAVPAPSACAGIATATDEYER